MVVSGLFLSCTVPTSRRIVHIIPTRKASLGPLRLIIHFIGVENTLPLLWGHRKLGCHVSPLYLNTSPQWAFLFWGVFPPTSQVLIRWRTQLSEVGVTVPSGAGQQRQGIQSSFLEIGIPGDPHSVQGVESIGLTHHESPLCFFFLMSQVLLCLEKSMFSCCGIFSFRK